MNVIGERLKHIRGEKSRAAFAREIGCHSNTLGNYERGDRSPDADFLMLLSDVGYNIHWVLTGEGNMFTALSGSAQTNSSLLRDVAHGVDASLDELGLSLPVDKKWELIDVICDMYSESESRPNNSTILRLVKSAS